MNQHIAQVATNMEIFQFEAPKKVLGMAQFYLRIELGFVKKKSWGFLNYPQLTVH